MDQSKRYTFRNLDMVAITSRRKIFLVVQGIIVQYGKQIEPLKKSVEIYR